jgi:hypothetical protein
MSRGKACPISLALVAMLPNAAVTSRHERSWHSATFAGSRIMLCIAVPDDADHAVLVDFRKRLLDHDFALTRGFVADIAIIGERTSAGEKSVFEIEVLLLDD